MNHLSDLLARIALPEPEAVGGEPAPPSPIDAARPFHEVGRTGSLLLRELGADLPEGHLHLWSGPMGAGKTPLLLTLLHGAAQRGRRVAYATYDLAPESLALRLLAMCSGIPTSRLPDPDGRRVPTDFTPQEVAAARAAREWLSALPFFLVPARGFTVDSLRDRLVRMPFRPSVLAVDYLQAVVRPAGSDSGVVLRQLSELAAGLHLAVLCAARATSVEGGHASSWPPRCADRVGYIAPAEGSSSLRAEVLENRYGACPSLRLSLDEESGHLTPTHPARPAHDEATVGPSGSTLPS